MKKLYYFVLFIIATILAYFFQQAYIMVSSFYVLFVLDGLILTLLIFIAELFLILIHSKKIVKCPNCQTRRVFNAKKHRYYECSTCHMVIDVKDHKSMNREYNRYNTLILAITMTCLKDSTITAIQEKLFKQYLNKMINEEYGSHTSDLYKALFETSLEIDDLLKELSHYKINKITAHNLIEFIFSILIYRNFIDLKEYPHFKKLVNYYGFDESQFIEIISQHNEPVYLKIIASIFQVMYKKSSKEHQLLLEHKIQSYIKEDQILNEFFKLLVNKIFVEKIDFSLEEVKGLNDTLIPSYKTTLMFNLYEIFSQELTSNKEVLLLYRQILSLLDLNEMYLEVRA